MVTRSNDPTGRAEHRPRRSTRDRPAKAPLSEDAVVDAALAILGADGPDAVSMRRVAQALDTGAASLYVYVAGRGGLVEAMLDRVMASIELEPPDPTRWREQLHTLLERTHRALVAHPGIAAMTLADPPTTEHVLGLAENMLGILLAGAVDPQDAAWACDILVALVHAGAREDYVRQARGGARPAPEALADDVHETLTGLAPERFPLLVAHADRMVAGDSAQRLTFAVDLVLAGLVARTPA